ncbi:Knirps-like isoform B [Frankliniella occidentalis]|nr:Knirps-like isoform B [Frankliniella occidentalis]
MSKSGSRYGRRSNWFKIHCLLQEQQHQHQQQHQQQQQHGDQQPPRWEPQVQPPRTSPPEKSPKGESQGPRPRLEGLYGGSLPPGLPPMLWAGPRGLLPPPPPHGPPLGMPFPPFLPAAAAAAAAAFNGGVPPPLFGLPPPGAPGAAPQAAPQRPEWGRLVSRPASPRLHLHPKAAPVVPQPLRGPPPGVLGRPSPPGARLDEGDDADQEQPMDLSRTASRAPTPPSAAQGRRHHAEDKDDASDSGVSEREGDRAADGDPEADSDSPPRLSPSPRPSPRPSPGSTPGRPPSPSTAPVDLSLS